MVSKLFALLILILCRCFADFALIDVVVGDGHYREILKNAGDAMLLRFGGLVIFHLFLILVVLLFK